ncbi:MAG: hypothetical protein ABI662_07190 [Dermatophilaceae bacterium]
MSSWPGTKALCVRIWRHSRVMSIPLHECAAAKLAAQLALARSVAPAFRGALGELSEKADTERRVEHLADPQVARHRGGLAR